jgi:hypothetical protein
LQPSQRNSASLACKHFSTTAWATRRHPLHHTLPWAHQP